MPEPRKTTTDQLRALSTDYRRATKDLVRSRKALVARMRRAAETESLTAADLGRIVGVHRHTASVWLGRRDWRKR